MLKKWVFGLVVFLSLCFCVGCSSTILQQIDKPEVTQEEYRTIEHLYRYKGSIETQTFKVPAEVPDFTWGDVETQTLVSGFLYLVTYVYDECVYLVFITAPDEIEPRINIIALVASYVDTTKDKHWIYQDSLPVLVLEEELIAFIGNTIEEVSGTGDSDKKSL